MMMRRTFSKVLQCVKLEKINKIKFTKFIWFYWKMKKKLYIYIYIYIYIGGFPAAGMREKKF